MIRRMAHAGGLLSAMTGRAPAGRLDGAGSAALGPPIWTTPLQTFAC